MNTVFIYKNQYVNTTNFLLGSNNNTKKMLYYITYGSVTYVSLRLLLHEKINYAAN